MDVLRRRLRVWATVWLLCQTVSLSALTPRACCPAHAGDAEASPEDCHKAGADRCPMASADGQPCPEHAGRPADSPCTIGGCCNAPAIALASLIWTLGVTGERFESTDHYTWTRLFPVAHAATAVPRSLDSPPPRV